MLNRLSHCEIHEADTHARSEEHCQPREIGEVGLSIVWPQPQPSRRAESQH